MNSDKLKNKRRINGIFIFGVLILTVMIFTYQPAVNKIHCTEEILAQKPDIVMLAAWWCTYCYKARKYFHKNKISYCEYDMENSEEGKALYKKVNGRGVPVLLIGDHQINGFDETSIETALSELHSS